MTYLKSDGSNNSVDQQLKI